ARSRMRLFRSLLEILLASQVVIGPTWSLAWAQNPLAPAKPASQGAPAAPSDSLGRETPHGSSVGFLRSAQDGKLSVAAQYFEPAAAHHRLAPEEEQELAEELLTILDQKFGPILDSISHDPQGRLDDGLPANQEVIYAARGDTSGFSILLVR